MKNLEPILELEEFSENGSVTKQPKKHPFRFYKTDFWSLISLKIILITNNHNKVKFINYSFVRSKVIKYDK